MPVRLKDIARDLNLSKMTISKVLRGQTDVSAETKARVLQRVKELNYRPNISARSLRTGQSFSIGLVIPSLADPFFGNVAKGIVQTARVAGYGLSISSAEDDPQQEEHEIELQLSRQVDALIVASLQESPDFFQSLGHQKAPLILIDRTLPSLKAHFVGLRDADIGYLAAEHLIHAGCRKLAYLRGPRSASADLRYSGYRAALVDFGLPFRQELIVDADGIADPDYQRGVDAMLRLLEGRIRPEGVMCYNDVLALGVIDAAIGSNLMVPDNIAVVGCGNSLPFCEMKIPLSSVDLAGVEVGSKTAKLALRIMASEGAIPQRRILVSPKVVVRRSSAR